MQTLLITDSFSKNRVGNQLERMVHHDRDDVETEVNGRRQPDHQRFLTARETDRDLLFSRPPQLVGGEYSEPKNEYMDRYDNRGGDREICQVQCRLGLATDSKSHFDGTQKDHRQDSAQGEDAEDWFSHCRPAGR